MRTITAAAMLLLAGCATLDTDILPLLEGDHTLQIRLWDVTDEGIARLLQRVHGRQSRDIGRLIRDEAARCARDPRHRCEAKPHAGEYAFVVVLRHLNFALVPGATIARNGVSEPVPQGFGRWRNTIEVAVKDGIGSLTIPASWVNRESIMLIRSPWPPASIYYPPSGVLRTYRSAEGADGVSELYRLVRDGIGSDRRTNYHFAR